MLFTSSMMTTLIIISMMQPMMNPHSVIIPLLLGKALALKFALFVVPKVAIGAVLFGQGAALIGGPLIWRYLALKRVYRHRHPPPHFRHYGHGAHHHHNHHGWGPGQTVGPILHQKFNAAYNKGHRAIDYLAWGLDQATWGARFVGDRLSEKAVKALYLASELSKPTHGIHGHLHHHPIPYAHSVAHAHPHPHPHVEPIVAHKVPVVTEVIEQGPHGTVFHSPGDHGHGHGPGYYHPDTSGSHSVSPTESVLLEDGPGAHGSSYGPPESEHETSYGPPEDGYSSSYGAPEEDGHSASYGHGGGAIQYSSAFDGAVGGGYGGSGYESDIGPEYTAEGSSVPANSVPLDRDEFMKLLDWAGRGSDEYETQASTNQETYQSNERFTTAPVDPEVEPARVVRIKRNGDSSAEEYKKSMPDTFTKYIIEDVRRFFTIVQYLDENKCLQKLVCDVHAKAKAMKPEERSTISSYETHIISAFRVLETFMPSIEDSSTNYRVAARLGLTAPSSTKFCSTYYDSCKYTAQDIIGFNEKIETNQIEDIKITKGVDVQAQLEMLEKQNREAGMIGEGEAVGTTTTEEPSFPKV